MNRLTILLLLLTSATGFVIKSHGGGLMARGMSSTEGEITPEASASSVDASVLESTTGTTDQPTKVAEAVKSVQPKKKPVKKSGGAKHQDGVFSPIVRFSKLVIGDSTLKTVRTEAIKMHSGVIGSFVETAESAFGDAVLRALFKMADTNGDGMIEEDELEEALKTLGFAWIKEKQATVVFKRADKDKSGTIDVDEWIAEAPKTLRVNLIKLAKQNGGDMGLLA